MRNFNFPGRSQVYSSNAMVATSQPLASETAINTLKKGGNAMDAAIAAAAVLAVIEPTDTGIGGDCFALYSKRSTTAPIAFNGSGKSPANISINKLNNLKIDKSIPDHSPHSITIPGAVDAWFQLHEKFCNLEFEESCINYNKNNIPSRTVSVLQVRDKIYNSSVNLSEKYHKHFPFLDQIKKGPHKGAL